MDSISACASSTLVSESYEDGVFSPMADSFLCACGDARRLSSSAVVESVELLSETSNGMLCVLKALRTKRSTAAKKLRPRAPKSSSALSFRPFPSSA